MTKSIDIYDLLTKTSIDDLTISNLDSATGRTAIDRESIEFWKGILTVSHVLKAARTYSHGLPIPETGTVQIETIPHGENATITPTGTEIWQVQNIALDNCECSLKDSDGNASPINIVAPAAGLIPTTAFPIYLSATMSIFFNNVSGAEQTPSIAYLKVSL